MDTTALISDAPLPVRHGRSVAAADMACARMARLHVAARWPDSCTAPSSRSAAGSCCWLSLRLWLGRARRVLRLRHRRPDPRDGSVRDQPTAGAWRAGRLWRCRSPLGAVGRDRWCNSASCWRCSARCGSAHRRCFSRFLRRAPLRGPVEFLRYAIVEQGDLLFTLWAILGGLGVAIVFSLTAVSPPSAARPQGGLPPGAADQRTRGRRESGRDAALGRS